MGKESFKHMRNKAVKSADRPWGDRVREPGPCFRKAPLFVRRNMCAILGSLLQLDFTGAETMSSVPLDGQKWKLDMDSVGALTFWLN